MPKKTPHQLVWDMGDPESDVRPEWIIKANYASLEEALVQARHDLERGINILGIVKLGPKHPVHEMSAAEREEHYVWTPKDDE